MHDSFCPLCKAKLKQQRLQWRSLWNPFPAFRCPSCATLLTWNKWWYARSVLIFWSVLLVPIVVVNFIPQLKQSPKLRAVLFHMTQIGVLTSLIAPAVLYCLLPLAAKPVPDESTAV